MKSLETHVTDPLNVNETLVVDCAGMRQKQMDDVTDYLTKNCNGPYELM